MIQIGLEALEGKTIGEILQLAEQVKNLPEGFKLTYQKPEENFAEKLIVEINKGEKIR